MDFSIRIAEKITSGPQREGLIRQAREFQENWPAIISCLIGGFEQEVDTKRRDQFLDLLQPHIDRKEDYIQTIRGLDHDTAITGTTWLQNIVDDITHRALHHLPSCRS
jgi:hypothetical protein